MKLCVPRFGKVDERVIKDLEDWVQRLPPKKKLQKMQQD